MRPLRTAPWLVAAIALCCGAYLASPVLRAMVWRNSHHVLGWTEEARQADPEGFARHVEAKLGADLEKLQTARRKLATEVGSLARQQKNQAAMLARAEQFAAEFREAYQAARQSSGFPVSLHHANYSKAEIEQQVSLLLAEAAGCRRNMQRLGEIRDEAERRLEDLAVRVARTESQLSVVATQRRLLQARVLTEDAERLVAQVDALFDENRVVLHDNPVRTVRELMAAQQPPAARPSLQQARSYLTAVPSSGTAGERSAPNGETVKPSWPQAPAVSGPTAAGKPIFQQN